MNFTVNPRQDKVMTLMHSSNQGQSAGMFHVCNVLCFYVLCRPTDCAAVFYECHCIPGWFTDWLHCIDLFSCTCIAASLFNKLTYLFQVGNSNLVWKQTDGRTDMTNCSTLSLVISLVTVYPGRGLPIVNRFDRDRVRVIGHCVRRGVWSKTRVLLSTFVYELLAAGLNYCTSFAAAAVLGTWTAISAAILDFTMKEDCSPSEGPP